MNGIWVKWVDSNVSHRWLDADDVKTLHVFDVTSVCFLIREDERELLISETTGDDDNGQQATLHCPTAIPKVAIVARGTITLSGETPLQSGPTPVQIQARADFAVAQGYAEGIQ